MAYIFDFILSKGRTDKMAAKTVGTLISATTEKATPVNADKVALSDSAASNTLKYVSWANIKATLKTYFDTLYDVTGAVAAHLLAYAHGDIATNSSHRTTVTGNPHAVTKTEVGLGNVTDNAQVHAVSNSPQGNGEQVWHQLVSGELFLKKIASDDGSVTVQTTAVSPGPGGVPAGGEYINLSVPALGTAAKNYNSDGTIGQTSYNGNYVYVCVTTGTGGVGRWVRYAVESGGF
jgi:hypothetical protein